MLMLLLYVGDKRYAMNCEHVLEVIPRVELQPIIHAPKYVPGMLNYRGVPVPIIDLCQLLEERSCSHRLHTRIIVIGYPDIQGDVHLFGLVAERVTETMERQLENFIDTGVRIKDIPYLGGVMTEGKTVTQLLLLDALFSVVQEVLFSKDEEQ